MPTNLQEYVSFEYRAQYTDDMNCIASHADGSGDRSSLPFYDWQAVEASNRVPYHLGMRGTFTFKTWNKMPYVRKRICQAPRPGCSAAEPPLSGEKDLSGILTLYFSSSMGSTTRQLSPALASQRYLKVWTRKFARSSGLMFESFHRRPDSPCTTTSAPASTGYFLSGYPAPSLPKALHPPR